MERTPAEEPTACLSIALTPPTNARLQALAARAGVDARSIGNDLLADYEATLAGVERGLAAAAAGDEMDFEAFVAQRREKRRPRTPAAA